jgi:hypothetical protein
MTAISKTKATTTISDRRADKVSDGWLGTTVLIHGEDASAFDAFAARIRAALKPANAIEEIYVDDAIFHSWEVRRWRRAKGGLLLASSPAALARLLGRVAVKPLAVTLADGWSKGEPTAVAKVEALMESAGFTYDVAMGEAMAAKIDVMTGFDHLMAAAEGRFTTALKELERYRAGTAKTVQDIVDAEFEDVAGQINGEGDPHGK